MANDNHAKLVFVASNKQGKLDGEQQRRVRSHVLRRRPRESAEALDERRSVSALPAPAWRNMSQFRLSASGKRQRKNTMPEGTRSWAERDDQSDNMLASAEMEHSGQLSVITQPLFIPPTAIRLDKASFGILRNCHPLILRLSSFKRMGIKSDIDTSSWHNWLMEDIAYAHATIALSAMAQDFLYRRPVSHLGSFHAAKAMSLLNERLSDTKLAVQDSTVATIISLGGMSTMMADYNAASTHLSGLRLITHLRGGVDSFQDNPHLFLSICRLELRLSLCTGKTSASSDLSLPHSKLLLLSYSTAPCLSSQRSVEGLVSQGLAQVFHDLQALAKNVNDAASTDSPMSQSDFIKTLSSIQYRVFLAEKNPSSEIEDCIRMTLLALLSSTLDSLGAKAYYDYAFHRVQDLCQDVAISSSVPRYLMVWVLMICLVSSVLDKSLPWLRNLWQVELTSVTQGAQWDDIRHHLQGYIWINDCHDELGKQCFEYLSRDREQ